MVASSIVCESSGRIGIANNPGTAYEAFIAGSVSSTGDVTAYASDKRLKDNIRPITDALDKIKILNGIIYRWNDVAGTHGFNQTQDMVGLFAQEVESVMPEVIKLAPFDNDGFEKSITGENYKTVQYEKLVPLLVEGIKEQQLQIEELKNKIQILENNLKK